MQSGGAAAEEESRGAGGEDQEGPARGAPVKTEDTQVGGQLARVEFIAFWRLGGGRTDTRCTYVPMYISTFLFRFFTR